MRSVRPACISLAALVFVVVSGGCEKDAEGPLTLRGGGMVVDPAGTDVWFKISGCAGDRDDPVDLMVTAVTTSPRDSHVDARVSWYDAGPDVIAEHGEPPAPYRPVTATSHLGGTLNGCSLGVAVVLSPSTTGPVTARSVTVEYEVDGTSYSARTQLGAVLCPAGTHASGRGSYCTERRAVSS